MNKLIEKIAEDAFLDELEKIAKTTLKPHQERVLNRLEDEDAVLVYHGLGSGKTLTSLSAADKYNLPLNVVGPASLKHNFPKEKEKHDIESKVDVSTYNKPVSFPESLLVFDEAHRMGRPESKRSHYPDTMKGRKTLFMTGTPIRNHPSELIPLMRGLNINIPRDSKVFNSKFIDEIKNNPGIIASIFRGVKPGVEYKAKNLDQFKDLLKNKVDYHTNSTEDYPEVKSSVIETEMTPKQNEAYEMALKQQPSLAYKIRNGIDPSKAESRRLNAFLSATRQISNNPTKFNLKATLEDAPKIQRAVKEIKNRVKKDKNYKGVTYSSYLDSGVYPMSELLKDVPHRIFTGNQSAKEKDEIVKDYNSGKIKQLLISGAGAEGLDLKGTKLMQILEPHWNKSLIDQVKGRAIRYKSHDHLPKDEQKVEVQEFVAKPRERGWWMFKKQDLGSDEYLRSLTKKKDDLNEQFLEAIREISEGS